MNIKMFVYGAFLMLSLLARPAIADFSCTIKDDQTLSKDGLMMPTAGPFLRVGSTFVVNFSSGAVLGERAPMDDLTVLSNDPIEMAGGIWRGIGRRELSRVLTLYDPANESTRSHLLEVSLLEIILGQEQREYPFIYYRFGTVLSGTCGAF